MSVSVMTSQTLRQLLCVMRLLGESRNEVVGATVESHPKRFSVLAACSGRARRNRRTERAVVIGLQLTNVLVTAGFNSVN